MREHTIQIHKVLYSQCVYAVSKNKKTNIKVPIIL